MVKQEKRKYMAYVIIAAAVLCGVVLGVGASDEPFGFMKVSSPADAAAFLIELGWECDQSGISVQESVLPAQFDETFIGYNAIQLEQGCDLTKYAGKTVTIVTAPITNYSQTEENVFATLIIYRSTVIGGDIHSAEMNGFMHTLR